MKLKLFGAAVLVCLSLSACATGGRFDFGSYDASLYVYSKKPDQLAVFEQSLKDTIARGRASGRLAPGLQAELGYCYLGEGRKLEALDLFKAEMADFPESRAFLAKFVSQAES